MKKSLLTLALTFAAITFSLTVRAKAQSLTYLADFNGTNGYLPLSSVIQATDGNFYGTTYGYWQAPIGNVFQVTQAGELRSIYKFCSQANCADGNTPSAVILGSDGDLYGTTAFGGSSAVSAIGSGTIFKMTLGGEITTLYTFCTVAACTDGQYPTGLILASDGNFYGTASGSGDPQSLGTLFRISPDGKFSVLHSFCASKNCADGAGPSLPIQGADGNFYGTTGSGGAANGGVAYQFTASGKYKVLHNFCDGGNGPCPDGSYLPTIVQGANGNFYGITEAGGRYDSGVVFELTPAGKYTVLHSFPVGLAGFPQTQLTLASDGNFYSTTGGGAPWTWDAAVLGEIFEITKAGKYKRLVPFQATASDGYSPLAALFQATDGNFYGTTAYGGIRTCCIGGESGYGTVFQFSNGLGPLVETVPTASKVGKSVLILGNGLIGTSSVKFNGVAATFTVESDTYIRATVPAGATTARFQSSLPSGTLNSSPRFVVTK